MTFSTSIVFSIFTVPSTRYDVRPSTDRRLGTKKRSHRLIDSNNVVVSTCGGTPTLPPMSRIVQSRALDAVYDPVYAVSHSGGSFRKGTYRPGGISTAASNNNNNTALITSNPTEGYGSVSGPERAKFFQRPILPFLQTEPPEVLLAPIVSPSKVAQSTSRRHEDDSNGATRSVGVQTMYRDSEAQTDPYSPDYTVPQSLTGQRDVVQPEILSLAHVKFGAGLPAGRAELELIERTRAKQAFEASLPPMTDEASFLLRKAMMETQETREWAHREREIDALHAQRLAMLQQALEERDKENEFLAEQRLEALRQRLLHDKENALEKIQQSRVSALRKLTRTRHQLHAELESPKPGGKRDIIAEYADFASDVYAPVTRAGGGTRSGVKVGEVGIERPTFQQLESLRAFERAIPSTMLVAARQKPKDKTPTTAKERKQAAIDAHLLKMESLIKLAKDKDKDRHGASSTTTGSSVSTDDAHPETSTLASRKRAQQQQQQLMMARPPTPDFGTRSDVDDAREDAVRLLQKLVRGRAVQNMMFEGKARRAELIAELRASDEAAAAMAPRLPGGRHASGNVDEDDDVRVARATMHKAEGEVVSEMLDFLFKELDRTREIAKQKAFVDAANEQRRRREVEEGGRRQAEEMLRDREDEVFRRIERVHVETAMDLIDDVVMDVILEQAHASALRELDVLTTWIAPGVSRLEDKANADELVVKDLVASFLLPHVQRQHVRDQLAQEERKYVTAAHALLTEAVAHGSANSTSPS